MQRLIVCGRSPRGFPSAWWTWRDLRSVPPSENSWGPVPEYVLYS